MIRIYELGERQKYAAWVSRAYSIKIFVGEIYERAGARTMFFGSFVCSLCRHDVSPKNNGNTDLLANAKKNERVQSPCSDLRNGNKETPQYRANYDDTLTCNEKCTSRPIFILIEFLAAPPKRYGRNTVFSYSKNSDTVYNSSPESRTLRRVTRRIVCRLFRLDSLIRLLFSVEKSVNVTRRIFVTFR